MTKTVSEKHDEQHKLQEKIVMYQLLQNHIEQLKQQLMAIEREFLEIDGTTHAVKTLSSGKEAHETYIPIGTGCFVDGKINNKKSFLLNVGAGIMIKKSIVDISSFLEDNKKERERFLNKIKGDLGLTVEKINGIAKEILEMQQKQK